MRWSTWKWECFGKRCECMCRGLFSASFSLLIAALLDCLDLAENGVSSYPGEVFGSREASLTGKCPQHTRSGGYETYGSEKLSDYDDAGLHLSAVSFYASW